MTPGPTLQELGCWSLYFYQPLPHFYFVMTAIIIGLYSITFTFYSSIFIFTMYLPYMLRDFLIVWKFKSKTRSAAYHGLIKPNVLDIVPYCWCTWIHSQIPKIQTSNLLCYSEWDSIYITSNHTEFRKNKILNRIW